MHAVLRPVHLFHLLIPGVFLLLNLSVAGWALILPLGDTSGTKAIQDAVTNPAFAATSVVVVGLCFGVTLRLKRTHYLDQLSARWIVFRGKAREDDTYIRDGFPYIAWIQEVCEKRMPPAALAFFNAHWRDRQLGKKANADWVNSVKMIVARVDTPSATELSIQESMIRFIASIAYALAVSWLVLMSAAVYSALHASWAITAVFLIAGIVYPTLFLTILSSIRLMRCKEAVAVFIASFANCEEFDRLFPPTTPGPGRDPKPRSPVREKPDDGGDPPLGLPDLLGGDGQVSG